MVSGHTRGKSYFVVADEVIDRIETHVVYEVVLGLSTF